MIRNVPRCNSGLLVLRRRRQAGAIFQSMMILLLAALLVSNPIPVSAATSDPVLDWIGIMNTAVLADGSTSPLATSRVVALISASVFDAVNGIEPRLQPLHVKPDAPHHASQRAAAIQAAYAILLHLYPKQSGTLTAQRNASLAALGSSEKAQWIDAGVTWGQTVADAIWAWRLTDGIAPAPPPFLGVLGIVGTPPAVGAWRPTPLANGMPGASGAAPQFASMNETTARISFKSLGIPGRWLVRSREGDQSGRTVSLFRKIAAAAQA